MGLPKISIFLTTTVLLLAAYNIIGPAFASAGDVLTLEDGKGKFKRSVEGRKMDLINRAGCSSNPAWRKVDPSMVNKTHSVGVKSTLGTDETGGLKIKAEVTNNGCGKGPGSALVVHIKGDWKQIIYTQVFKRSASCWGIFGNDYTESFKLNAKSGLEVFNPSFGDIIFGQKGMKSKTDDIFDGKSSRCDNEQKNFWHENNGNGERQATVMLRRKMHAKDAGVQTGTSCGTPHYEIKDIYVLL